MKPKKRILIIGQPGSGKSTLARAMGKLLGLPVFHMDHIHWQAGWIERSEPEKDRLCSKVYAQDRWIFEGSRSIGRADTLIWLDFPLTVRAYRVCRRTVRYLGETRPDLPDGCPERFNLEFMKWIWNTRKSSRHKMQKLFDSAPEYMDKYRLTNQRQVNELINETAKT